jgi:GNAT superfamily N-acetyltransferase
VLADAEEVAGLFDEYRQFYGQAPDLPTSRRFMTERLIRRDSVIYWAFGRGDGGRVAMGFTQLYPSFSSTRCGRLWILNDLYVRSDFRGRGVARALMERARAHALETGACGLELMTARDNVSAQRLYEALGYQRDDVFLHYELSLAR